MYCYAQLFHVARHIPSSIVSGKTVRSISRIALKPEAISLLFSET